MAYSISNVSGFDPQLNEYYFFDANIWIAAIKQNHCGTIDIRIKPYIEFFDAVVSLNNITDPKIVKRLKFQPKIIMTSMLLSEIINAYLRKVSMVLFYNNNMTGIDFKRDYREMVHSDYEKQLKNIVSDIQAFNSMLHFVDDDFKSMDASSIFPFLNRKVDFNDFYYFKLMKSLNIPIVTDDKDFNFEDILILTENTKLLKLK
jgi:hypothetical protein